MLLIADEEMNESPVVMTVPMNHGQENLIVGSNLMEPVMTVPQVAEYLQISKSKIYLMIKRGEIPYIRIGKCVRIMESDLDEWLEARRQPARQLGFKFPEMA